MLIILFWRFYFLITTLLIFNIISQLLFSKRKHKYKTALKALFFVVFWPLTIFSPAGRKYLTGKIDSL